MLLQKQFAEPVALLVTLFFVPLLWLPLLSHMEHKLLACLKALLLPKAPYMFSLTSGSKGQLLFYKDAGHFWFAHYSFRKASLCVL